MAILGIDLGTTYSLVGVFRDGAPSPTPDVLGSRLTPSVVGLDDDGQILVGQAAKEQLITHPDLTAATVKRFMGTNRLTRLGSREFQPEELSSVRPALPQGRRRGRARGAGRGSSDLCARPLRRRTAKGHPSRG